MSQWISATGIFDGDDVLTDHSLCITNGRVSALAPVTDIPPKATVRDHKGLIAAGFFDIQVNGGGGALFNAVPTADGIATIAAAHRKAGTTALMPTIITDSKEVLEAAAQAIVEARAISGVKGIHIEGPHISLPKRGTHDARHVRPFDDHTMGIVRELREEDIPVLITIAPEAATEADIVTLVATGAHVALGHSNASAEEAEHMFAAGARLATHLFNAMSPMTSREPGLTGAAIASEAWCSVIADGIHVDPTMVALACRARPVPGRMIAISDAMATVGGPDSFTLYDQTISLKEGRLINAEGALAGAHLTMHEAFTNLVSYGIPLTDALRMCRNNPAAALGLEAEFALIGCAEDDLLFMTDDLKLDQVGTVSAG